MHLAAEDQLLILSARTHYDENILISISKLLQKSLDWDYVVSASIQHSTALLLYNALKLATGDFKKTNAGVPDSAKTELETLYLNNHKRTARLRNVLAEIFEAFRENDIEVIALKELGLIQFAYPDANLHPIGDLDLLIHKRAFKDAKKCLSDLDFSSLPAEDCHFHSNYLDGFQFHRRSDNTWLDIQWDLENKSKDISGDGPLNFGVSRMWQNARSIELAGHQVLVPCPVDMLFHLCLHLEGHGYTELILLTDIAEAIKAYKDNLNWGDLIRLTKKFGMQGTVYYALLWVEKLFDAPVPSWVIDALIPSYCKAFFFESIFNNLGTLHNYADEINMVANPPNQVRCSFEKIVRKQASGARHVYQVVDEMMRAFNAAGGRFIHLNGEPSRMILPSSTLPAFNPLQLIIFADDLPFLYSTLQDSGFKEQAAVLEKTIAFQTTDPVLENCHFNLTVKWKIEADKRKFFGSLTQTRPTKKELAKHIIKTTTPENGSLNLNLEFCISVYALHPEEILAYLCAETGQMQNRKLLATCNLLDFFRAYSLKREFDWNLFSSIMSFNYPRLIPQSYNSLIVASCAADSQSKAFIQNGLSLLKSKYSNEISASGEFRLFTWARHSPDTFSTYNTSLKYGIFVVLTFLSVKGFGAKLKYLFQLISSVIRQERSLSRLGKFIIGMPSLALRAFGVKEKEHYSPRDFVYWIE